MERLVVLGLSGVIGLVLAFVAIRALFGFVITGENEVGIVVKRIDILGRKLPPGLHFGYTRLLFNINKITVTGIRPGEIGLVVSADGSNIPESRLLGRQAPCRQFQDARLFWRIGVRWDVRSGSSRLVSTGSTRISSI